MPIFHVALAKLRGLFSKQADDFDEEIREHIDLLTRRYIANGMSKDAAYAARRQFGNRGLLEQKRAEMRTFQTLETLWRDLRYGLRQLRMNPGLTSVAVLCLALGIGANTAIFTLLDQLVLRLLPVKQPERLVMIWSTGPPLGYENGQRASSYPMYQDFQRDAQAFDFVFCRFDQQLAMGFEGRTERVNSELVSGNYFQALGVGPARGRVFSPGADDRIYKGHPVAVLSYRFWMSRFAGDPNIVGSKILLNNYPMEVVGVSAPGFAGLDPSRSPDVWVPIQMKPLMTPAQDGLGDRRGNWIQIFARRKPGYSVERARASLEPLFHQILVRELATDPELRRVSQYDRERFLHRTVIVQTAANGYSDMREQYSTALVMLMAMAALILLIACANVASLLIARAAARQKEIAVRLAIGAGRRTLIRQLLIEGLLLSLGGAALGLVLSTFTTRALLQMLPGAANLMLHAEPDARILFFSTAVAVATGLLFGLAPALHGTRLDLAAALKDVASAATGSSHSVRLRKILVAMQMALSVLLLAGASLFARTLINLKDTRTGFRDIDHLATFQVDPAKLGYPPLRIRNFYEDLARELRAVPGVQSAAYSVVPIFQDTWWGWGLAVEGHRAKEGESMQAHVNVISPGYFRTMGVPLLRGRDFDERDRPSGLNEAQMPSVAIVNRKFAEHYFGNASPIGRHIGSGSNSDAKLSARIIGEVEDSLYEGPREGVPQQVFYCHSEAPVPLRAYFYVRTAGDPAVLFAKFRRAVAKLDSFLPVDDMTTLGKQLDETLSTERLIAFLSVVFGVLATVLAALGLYGVMAFTIARRTKEIGVRVALGAGQGAVLWLVLREVIMLLAAGLALGVPCALLLSQYVSSQLFGVKATDLWTWSASIAILGAAAAFSALVPARRASAIDPIKALRYE